MEICKMFGNIKDFFNLIDNAVILINIEGQILYINNRAEEILRLDKNCINKYIKDVYKDTQLIKTMEEDIIQRNARIDIYGRCCLSTRMPIKRDDKIVGAIAIFDDITKFKVLKEQLEVEKNERQILKLILETAYDGILVVDKNGYITMISDAYKKFLNLEDRDVIGKHVTKIILHTRMHKVVETGKAEINQFQEVNGQYMMATRIPYFIDGKIAGAIGKVIFRNASEIMQISKNYEILASELHSVRNEIKNMHNANYHLKDITTRNYKVEDLKNDIKKISGSNLNVLILGESGTGKELFAQALHNESKRKDWPFVSVNCAAIPENLLEAELFGYEKGAFTGASADGKIGKFELSDNGTIFLDEIADMHLKMQAKILRVIQEGVVEKIGSNKPKKINIRVVAATNKNILEMIKNKEFREDLYYRLNVFQLKLPPLRKRRDDIILICEKFIDHLNYKNQKNIIGLSTQAKSILMRYDWPGNIRELRNVIERAFNILEGENYIQPWHLPSSLRTNQDENISKPIKDLMDQAEKKFIMDRLIYFNGNKSKTAKDLGISRVTFHKKLIKHELV